MQRNKDLKHRLDWQLHFYHRNLNAKHAALKMLLMGLTNLFFDGVNQVDVVLRHQRDGHSVSPCRGAKYHSEREVYGKKM